MKKLNELKEIAKEYASKKLNKETILDGPIFRIDNGKLCLEYLVVEFNDKENEDYRLKRPTEWLLQDIGTGEIIDFYSINEKDFSTIEDLPLDKLFENNGKSPLFDYSNYIIRSYFEWQKKVESELKEKIQSNKVKVYEEKILKVDENIISPQDHILANIEDAFEKMYNIVLYDIGGNIGTAFEAYAESLFDSIRNKYVEEKIIDYELVKAYMNYLKYSWPESLELYNKCSNILEAIDKEFDQKIVEMLNTKK